MIEKQKKDQAAHDDLVSLVWNLFRIGNNELAGEIHKSTSYHPFTWAVEHWPEKGLTLNFSSVKEEIVEAIRKGAEEVQNTGEAIKVREELFSVKTVIPVRDLHYIGRSLTLQAVSPIIIRHKQTRSKAGIVRNMLFHEDPAFWTKKMEDNLRRRAEAFYGKRDADVHIDVINAGRSVGTVFKGMKQPGRVMLMKVSGSEEVLRAALYGGIGEKTACGFGMLTPA